MSRRITEQLYQSRGLNNYQLSNLQDLKAIYDIDIIKIKGYVELDSLNKMSFERF